jgi:ABC-type sugar transport system ATPase subunit
VTVVERAPLAGTEILRIDGLSKTFPGTRALRDASIDILAGEVHALVGHNGSGKSTLIKILSGYHAADPGARAWLDGASVELEHLAQGAHGRSRLSFVHQELGLVLELDTIDNLAIRGGYRRARSGLVDWREQRAYAASLLAPFGLDFDLALPLSKVTPVERTIVAIAAALQGWDSDRGVLVLDEPTAVLPPFEVRRLMRIVRDVRATGAGVLYVSHRLDEIFELADRVTVLRGGVNVATRRVADISKRELVELMLGDEAPSTYERPTRDITGAAPVLEARGLSGVYVRNVDLTLRAHEVVGVAGLPSDGRDELPRLLTDRRRSAGGRLRVPGPAAEWQPIRKFRGARIALLPPDRATEGVIAPMTVAENLSLSVIDRLTHGPLLRRRDEASFVDTWIRKLSIKVAGRDSGIVTLSGGNQQKVLFGRALGQDPAVVVMCEPTAGIDIGARTAIYRLIAEQAAGGLAVLVTSSDVADLLAVCHRVLVLREGVVAHELSGTDLTERQLVSAMEGIE